MSIHLKTSNSLKSLAEALAGQIGNKRSVFRPVYIVTQTEGMNSWLKMRIAEKNKIAANIEFLTPNGFINLAYRLLGGAFKDTLSEQAFDWLLFKALKEPDFVNRFPKVAAYYNSEKKDSEVKRIALAKAVADLFDQYQIYRTGMIEQWHMGKYSRTDPSEDELWQAALWQKASGLVPPENFPDKSDLKKRLLSFLKEPSRTKVLKEAVPVVYFFGLSLLTRYHNSILFELSKVIEVQFLIQNPATLVYWLEDQNQKKIDYLIQKGRLPEKTVSIANPLLVNWGGLIQSTFQLLYQDENLFNLSEEIGVLPPQTDTLLHQLQSTIFNNQKEGFKFTRSQVLDGSITINSCFSPLREVESLYNYLLYLVDKKGAEITPRDIVVMTPDIDAYAPYIRAVFDNANPSLSYSIADESLSVADSLTNSLSSILSLREENFTSAQVLNLLEFPSLKKRFKLQNSAKVRQWVEDANIRFGFENDAQDDTDLVSWNYGMKRIMYGICMSGEEEYNEGQARSFYPLDEIEGFDSFDAIRFMKFVRLLEHAILERKTRRNLSGWVRYINDLLTDFFEEEGNEEESIQSPLRAQLDRYLQLQEVFEEKISYEVFLQSFLPILNRIRRSGNFGLGNITFCSLIPMRSIPFKVVAVLGMNFDKFPRIDKPLGFDLMIHHYQPGDRKLKENDKNLFLETLLSAGDFLYFSYLGQSVKDKSQLPPSALLDELVDFVGNNLDEEIDVRSNLITVQPLYGFSRKYNTLAYPRLYSYLIGQKTGKEFIFKTGDPLTMENEPLFSTVYSGPEEIRVKDLTVFLKHPIKGYFNQTLKVYLEDQDNDLPEEEIFELDSLQEWQLRNDLLHLNDAETDQFLDFGKKNGRLPLKNSSKIVLDKAVTKVSKLRQTLKQFSEGYQEAVLNVDLTLDGISLTGQIGGIYGNRLIRYCLSNAKREEKYRLEAYVEYLVCLLSGRDLQLIFIDSEGVASRLNWPLEEGRTAQTELKTLLEIYKMGLKQPIPYYYEFKIRKGDLETVNAQSFREKVNAYLTTGSYSNPDPYVVKASESGVFLKDTDWDLYKYVASALKFRMDFSPLA